MTLAFILALILWAYREFSYLLERGDWREERRRLTDQVVAALASRTAGEYAGLRKQDEATETWPPIVNPYRLTEEDAEVQKARAREKAEADQEIEYQRNQTATALAGRATWL